MSKKELMPEGEDLIVRSLGYLKPPASWKKRFNLKKSKSPRAFSQVDAKKGIRRLIFEWEEDELMEA